MFKNLNFNDEDNIGFCILKLSDLLYDLSLKLEKSGFKRVNYYPQIKCSNILNNCAPTNANSFRDKILLKDDIISINLFLGCSNGEFKDNDFNEWYNLKIIFDINAEYVEINRIKEFENTLIDEALLKVEEILKKYKYILKEVKRDKPIVEYIDFGILGSYPINHVNVENGNFDNIELEKKFIRKIMNNFSKNINLINDSIAYNIYKSLYETNYLIWNENSFYKIINKDLLPDNFEKLSDNEISEIFYNNMNYSEYNFISNFSKNLPFIEINKFKNDIIITNVCFNKEYTEISIEFNGLCNYFYAMVAIDYKTFKIKEFHDA